MEWKEDTIKAAIIGTFGLIGHWLLKNFKAGVTSFRKVLNDTDKIDKIEGDIFNFRQWQLAAIHINRNPIYILDCATGDMEYANPAWCQLLGFSDPEDAYGMGWMRAIPDSDTDRMIDENERFIKHPSNFEGIVRFKHLTGKHEIVCKCRNELIEDKAGKPIKAMGILEVIS